MKTVHLHGALSEFGGPYELDVETPEEAVRALSILLPGFRTAVATGQWSLIKGPLSGGEEVTQESLSLGLGAHTEVHILPAAAGAGGVVVIFSGITQMVWGVMSGNYRMLSRGWNKTTGGITEMFVQNNGSSDYGSREKADQRPSFLFDGPTNTSTQGLPVPVIYGRARVGSVVISAGITSEEV